jgi:serine/threonine-protein kinase
VLVRSTHPEGAVLGTFPAEGQPMRKGQTVAMVVSRGHAPTDSNTSFVVPEGLVGTEAKKAMSILGQDVRVTRVTIPGSGKDEVVGTWPSAGQPTTDGVVVLVVAGGDSGSTADSGDNGKGNKKDD